MTSGAARRSHLPGRPFLSPIAQGRGEHRMRYLVTGEYLAQIRNPDPFAVPAWRSPVYRTPGWVVIVAQLARVLWRLARFARRHPLAVAVTALVGWLYVLAGWLALALLAGSATVVSAVWRWRW